MKKKRLKPEDKPGIIKNKSVVIVNSNSLIKDIRRIIEETRLFVAATVNAGLTMLYWKIGLRVNNEILNNKRAAYGKEIVPKLSAQLVVEYGAGFTEKNLHRMIQFAEYFPEEQIVVTLSRQLSWSHFVAILPLRERLARDFYTEMCRVERWSVRTLRKKIDSMLFERTALSRKPAKLVEIELKQLREEDKLLCFATRISLIFLGLRGRIRRKTLRQLYFEKWKPLYLSSVWVLLFLSARSVLS